MPTLPPLDGYPVGLQIFFTLLFGIAAIGVGYSGYFRKGRSEKSDAPATASIVAATIADMGAIRHLSDCVIRLETSVQALIKSVDEQTHFERNNIEATEELNDRLRALTKSLDRWPQP